MDPLSITAASLAISEAVVGSLKILHGLHYAPTEIQVLINDVSDFQAVITEVQSGFLNRVKPGEIATGTLCALQQLLDSANSKLLQLKDIAERCLGSKSMHGRMNTLLRIRWIREKERMKRTRKELFEVKLSITTLGGAINSYVSLALDASTS